jgi:hypothetical protein
MRPVMPLSVSNPHGVITVYVEKERIESSDSRPLRPARLSEPERNGDGSRVAELVRDG